MKEYTQEGEINETTINTVDKAVEIETVVDTVDKAVEAETFSFPFSSCTFQFPHTDYDEIVNTQIFIRTETDE